jgi:pantoate--beta-alanine ligase
MIVFKQAGELTGYLERERNKGKKTGFTPTMGALHEGHLSLVRSSRTENDITVCSIFINPTQFNNSEDLRLYPVTIEKDIEMLLSAGCDILFLPERSEIYPTGYEARHYDLGDLENILEGFYRPGHFQGVCQVVERLLEIVISDNLYLGQKDFQQCMVIKKMIDQPGNNRSVKLKIMPTIREADGLAMSSRNLRLSKEERALALTIYNELCTIKAGRRNFDPEELKKNAVSHLEDKGFVVDYVEICNANDLSPANGSEGDLVALIAASIGQVRLIDNMLLN